MNQQQHFMNEKQRSRSTDPTAETILAMKREADDMADRDLQLAATTDNVSARAMFSQSSHQHSYLIVALRHALAGYIARGADPVHELRTTDGSFACLHVRRMAEELDKRIACAWQTAAERAAQEKMHEEVNGEIDSDRAAQNPPELFDAFGEPVKMCAGCGRARAEFCDLCAACEQKQHDAGGAWDAASLDQMREAHHPVKDFF